MHGMKNFKAHQTRYASCILSEGRISVKRKTVFQWKTVFQGCGARQRRSNFQETSNANQSHRRPFADRPSRRSRRVCARVEERGRDIQFLHFQDDQLQNLVRRYRPDHEYVCQRGHHERIDYAEATAQDANADGHADDGGRRCRWTSVSTCNSAAAPNTSPPMSNPAVDNLRVTLSQGCSIQNSFDLGEVSGMLSPVGGDLG
jgi:hypothetical protein